jgi:predicted ATPase/class 3 adenylate cyclase
MQLSVSPPACPVPAWSAQLAAPATARHTAAGQEWATVQTSIQFGNLEVRPKERQVLLDGQPAPVGGRAFDLLMALIERRDRVVTKDELFALVWPGLVVEENNLQVHISALRKLLGPQAILTLPGRGYRLTLRPDGDAAVPADALAAVAAAGMVTYLFTDIEGSSRLWEEHPQAMAQALARHDALCRELIEQHHGQVVKQTGDGVHAIFRQASEAITMAVALQIALAESTIEPRLQVRVGLNCGSDEFRNGDFYGPAVNRAARVMTAAHGEQVLVTQAVVDALRGQLPAGIALRDLGNVRLRDLSSPERLHQVLHAQLRTEFPALRSLEATPNNLPQQLNSFIGRDDELAEVANLLAQQRLVTLLAMGGIGKSRLAVQLGAQILDRFADGVWLVELAPVTDPAAVPQALASVLGVREEPGTSLTETFLRHLRDRNLLVLLDNCEHLVGACAQLTKTLLQGTTGLKVLATSRDPLNIAGEASYPLRPLGVPLAGEIGLDTLLRRESVRLFVERARAVQPTFQLEVGNAAAVAEICARLDGIPLALELAAARVRVLTPQAIAERLDQRFKLLVAGDRTVLPRQRTLRALIDWSYDLLTPLERALFARLSVFAGSWTLEAAEAVGAGAQIESGDVLDLLSRLVEKSLVAIDVESARYRMLETVRQYAAERLSAEGEHPATRARHLDFFSAMVEQARPQLEGPEQAVWLKRLDHERENILAAHSAFDLVPDDAGRDIQLAAGLQFYWLSRGMLELGLRFTREALARTGAPQGELSQCRGLAIAGEICHAMGRYGEALDSLTDSLSIARVIDRPSLLARVLHALSAVEIARGNCEHALSYCDEAVAIASVGSRRNYAAAINNRGQILRWQGDLGAAKAQYEEVRSLTEQLGDHEACALAQLNLAMVAISEQQGEIARSYLVNVLKIVESIGSQSAGQSLLDVCAALAATHQDWRASARLLGAAESQAARAGTQRDAADQKFMALILTSARQALGSAFAERIAEGRRLTYTEAVAFVQECLSSQ